MPRNLASRPRLRINMPGIYVDVFRNIERWYCIMCRPKSRIWLLSFCTTRWLSKNRYHRAFTESNLLLQWRSVQPWVDWVVYLATVLSLINVFQILPNQHSGISTLWGSNNNLGHSSSLPTFPYPFHQIPYSPLPFPPLPSPPLE